MLAHYYPPPDQNAVSTLRLEVLSPLEDTKSPIDNVLAKNGATPYHVCYCVKNISKIVEKLREAGFIPIGAVAKSEPLEGNVCFMFSSDIGLIELIEYPKTKN